MAWNIRLIKPEEAEAVSKLAEPYRDKVSPYVLNPTQIMGYLDEWLVAIDNKEYLAHDGSHYVGTIGGALHFIEKRNTRNYAYLLSMKQVDPGLINKFWPTQDIFMSQPTCPGKGSLRALVDHLKAKGKPMWCWLSIVSPVIRFYEEQLGFVFSPGLYEFMNIYKGDYSTFRVGIWHPE